MEDFLTVEVARQVDSLSAGEATPARSAALSPEVTVMPWRLCSIG